MRPLHVVAWLSTLLTSVAVSTRGPAARLSTPAHPTASVDSTTLVVLGVSHSGQLAAPKYHPGYFRAFFDRVRPAAICVERSPDEFARGDYYEFTYEVQHIAVPYARAHGIDLCPIDWLPSRDDERLAFGRLEVVDPPIIRPASGFQSFFTVDSASLRLTLFYADSEPARRETRAFFDAPRAPGARDFPRRLDLYRTFMQAMRVQAALRAHAGRTVLVVVGAMHKEDIEHILTGAPGVRIAQPSEYGAMPDTAALAQLTDSDMAAILSFNLLGMQSVEGPVAWSWVSRILDAFTARHAVTEEVSLLHTRYDVLQQRLTPDKAAAAYEHIASSTDSLATFTFTGVEDRRRVDSYYDPFGHLRVRQRALVEAAREWTRAGQPDRARQLYQQLLKSGAWTSTQRAELAVYWDRYIRRT